MFAAADRARLNLAAAHGHGKIGQEGIFRFAGAVGDDEGPSSLTAQLNCFAGLANGT